MIDYFSNLQLVILANSKSKDWYKACKEWISLGLVSEEEDRENRCVCSHPIIYNYEIVNKITNHKLIVGSCCVEQFDNGGLIKKVRRQGREFKNKKKGFNYHYCDLCDKKILEGKGDKYHKTCYQRMKVNDMKEKLRKDGYVFSTDKVIWVILETINKQKKNGEFLMKLQQIDGLTWLDYCNIGLICGRNEKWIDKYYNFYCHIHENTKIRNENKSAFI